MKTPLREEHCLEVLSTCYDPELPVSIVDLGLVYECRVTDLPEGGHEVTVRMTLTAPGCPVAGEMPIWVEDAVSSVPGVGNVVVNMVFDPPWTPERMSDEARVALDWY